MQFRLDAFKAVPSHIPPSCFVDILLLLSGAKPAMRLGPLSKFGLEIVEDWAKNWGFDCSANDSGFIYCSSNNSASVLRLIDDSFRNTTLEVGLALGYPVCCCKAISLVGEAGIDEFESTELAKWSFMGEYKLINPREYKDGLALVSHIPCTSSCESSLGIAKMALLNIEENATESVFSRWMGWLSRIGYS